jgi:UDP-N-acetyl-alpha-D-muramoyl-L-alanyl-L-glutamate epimerase
MSKFKTFVFDSYRLDTQAKRIDLKYSLDDEVWFTESVQLPAERQVELTPAVDRALFALHLAGGVSYYKTHIPSSLEIRSGSLAPLQANFWTTLYERGLGEFFYQNNIDFRGIIRFPQAADPSNRQVIQPGGSTATSGARRFLVPVGGGKDSIVTIELLKSIGADCTLFRSGSHSLVTAVADIAALPLLTVERQLSPELFRLNAEGALNGHVPVTAYLSFLTLTLSLLYGYDFIAMSNERSASEGNVVFHGAEVNHQWSKSAEFEKSFVHYVREWITNDVAYASLLRPLSELHIAGLFSQLPQYFDRATSCNNNWRIARAGSVQANRQDTGNSRWCGSCPKCTFAFALFASFLPRTQVVAMFGKDLLTDPALVSLYRMLLGVEGFKPFECVGTSDETRAALYLATRRGYDDAPVMQMFKTHVLPQMMEPDVVVRDLLTPINEHMIPEALFSRLSNRWGVTV